MQNKFITAFVLVAFTFVTLFSPFPAPVKHASAEVAPVNTGSLRLVTNTAGFSFKKDLMQGDTDPDVKELQKLLNSAPDTIVSVSGVGSAGQETPYFGPATKAAVIKFQEKYGSEILVSAGLSAGTGLVGLGTRTKLNNLLGVGIPTVASVGYPQSRAGSGSSVAYSPSPVQNPVITPTQTTQAPSMSVCSFVDLLINIGVIAPNLSAKAKNALNCNSTAPSVDVKVNGSQGPIAVLPGTEIRLSWRSENTKSCSDGENTLPTSGAVRLIANSSLSYPVSCIGNDGKSVVDSATVIISDQANATSTIEVLSSNITPGYDYAVFDAMTNVPTKMTIAYTNDPNSTSSVKIFESATSTVHSAKITGLVPNSTYYARVAFIVSSTDNVMTEELTFTTLAESENGELAQRVLSSATGNGVVSIPDSESLKANTQVTLEAWVKPTAWNTSVGMSNTSDSVVISRGQIGGHIDYVLSLDNGKLVYSNNDASIWTNMPVVPLNEWTHVAVTVNESANNISFYVNGVKINATTGGPRGVFNKAMQINKANAITEYDASLATNNPPQTSQNYQSGFDGVTQAPTSDTIESLLPENNIPAIITSNIYLGNFYPAFCNATSTEGNGFIGLIDDVKIYKIARTATQILADSATTSATSTASSTISEVSLVAHYSFDDGRATDLSNYMNNGSLKGDMEVLDDATALSPIAGSEFAMSGLEFNFSESCDAGLNALTEESAGYEVTFKGGVKSVTPSGQLHIIELETCDDPTEDLVKSVKMVGNAPARDASYYNNGGVISVTIAAGLGMKVPAVRDAIQGTALQYISGPGADLGAGSGANSVGYATNWSPQPKSCMKPPKSGGFGNWGIIAAVTAAVVATLFCPPCLGVMATMFNTIGISALTTTAAGATAFSAGVYTATAVTAAGIGYTVGSQIEKE